MEKFALCFKYQLTPLAIFTQDLEHGFFPQYRIKCFQITVEKPIAMLLLRTIATEETSMLKQSEFPAITCNFLVSM